MLELISPTVLLAAFGAFAGACSGSYLGCVAYRLPRGLSLLPASRCPGCGTRVAPHHNVPVLAWLWLRGRAGCCGAPLRFSYVLLEAAGALLGALVAVLGGHVALIMAMGALIGGPLVLSGLTRGRAAAFAPAGQDMRVLVCGSRGWEDRETIRNRLLQLSYGPAEGLRVIVSDEPGAGTIAGAVAAKYALDTEVLDGDWPVPGPDVVLAFCADGDTPPAVERARELGIRVELFAPA